MIFRWNNLNEAYGTDFEDTLAWVQKKFPNKSEKEQHQFAKNIMKRYVAPVETKSTDVVEKPKTRKNVKLIKIVDIPNYGKNQDIYCKSLLLRTARKPGDTERVNHTVLGRLNTAGVKYEIINENMNMNKKNIINEARRPANKQVGQHLFKGFRYDNNGNPLYICDTLSNEEAQAMGWKFSSKYGFYGQLSDPTMFYESKKNTIRLTESDLHRIIKESVKNILREHTNPFGYDKYEGEDMSYESVYDTAERALINGLKRNKYYSSAHELIETLYDVKSFNETDYETVYDACEQAMIDVYENE